MNRLLFCILFILVAAPSLPRAATAAVADHVASVTIQHKIDYEFPDTGDDLISFSLSVQTDASVEQVSVDCPGGRTFTIMQSGNQPLEEEGMQYSYSPESGIAEWEFYADYSNADPSRFAQFGDGIYQVTVQYTTGASETAQVPFLQEDGLSPIPIITAMPTFQQPLHNAVLEADQSVQFTWEPSATDSNANELRIEFERYARDTRETSQTFTMAENPGQYAISLASGEWEVDFKFQHRVRGNTEEGVAFQLAKSTESDLIMQLPPSTGVLAVPSTDYATIQAALDAAVDGTTVQVADGTYLGEGNRNLNPYGKAVTVVSENGPQHTLIDCEGSQYGFEFFHGESSDTVVSGFSIINAGERGIICHSSSPTIEHCIIRNNASGILCMKQAAPMIRECQIIDNVGSMGAGVQCYDHASPVIEACIIRRNDAGSSGGGGIACSLNSSPIIRNCLIVENRSNSGAIFIFDGSQPALQNCTISANTGTSGNGGGLHFSNATATLTNVILWGNSPSEIYAPSEVPAITYSIVSGGFEGVGNLDADPLFVDAAGGIYRPAPQSPAIEAGTAIAGVNADIVGNPRPAGGNYDIGAYEYLDTDGDGIVDDLDVCPTVADPQQIDTDGDGAGDLCDQCAGDPLKTAPGMCGCGHSELDSDGDTYPDCIDAFPQNASEWLDTDADGIGNNADSDDDGDYLPDTWEQQYGLDPLVSDADNDSDLDGFSNFREFHDGSNPSDANSVPELTAADRIAEIWISQGIDYVYPDNDDDTMHEFSFFAWTDGFVAAVSVSCPGGKTFTVTRDNVRVGFERTLYEYDPEADEAMFDFYADYTNTDISELYQYGDGDYLLTVDFDCGESYSFTIPFRKEDGISAIPYFTSIPRLAEPAQNATLPGYSPVEIRWNSEDIEAGVKDIGITCRRPATDVDSPEHRVEYTVDNDPGRVEFELGRGAWDLRYVYGYAVSATTPDAIPYGVMKGVASTYAIQVRGKSMPWLPLLLDQE